MKAKIASEILFFFVIFTTAAVEIPSWKETGLKADSFCNKTISRIKTAWNGVSENTTFAWYVLRDQTVHSSRDAEARTRLAIDGAKEKTSEMIADTKTKTGEVLTSTKKKAGEVIGKTKKQTGEIVEQTGESIQDGVRKTKQKVGDVIFE